MAKCLKCGNDKKFHVSMSEFIDNAIIEYKEDNHTELIQPEWARSDIRISFKACVVCGSNVIKVSEDEKTYSTFVLPKEIKKKNKKEPRPDNVFKFTKE